MSDEAAWLPGDLIQPERPSPREIVNEALAQKPIAVFSLLSGGDGSLAATHWAMNNVSGCQVAHVVTGIGMPIVEQFVRETCEREGWPLTVIYAKEDCGQDYDEIVSEHGFPGPAAHSLMYRRLKERAIEKLVRDTKADPRRMQRRRSDRVMLLTGICQDDSERRGGYGGAEITRKGAQLWVNAMYWMGQSWTAHYLEKHAIPRNPMSIKFGMSCECLCGAFSAPGELAMIRRGCPALADRIEALQYRVSNRHPWGWEDRPPRKVAVEVARAPCCTKERSMTNNTEARAREVLADIVAAGDPTWRAWLAERPDRSLRVTDAQAIAAMLAYGNERAAQEREANAAIAEQWRDENKASAAKARKRASFRGEDGLADMLDGAAIECNAIAQEIRARGAA